MSKKLIISVNLLAFLKSKAPINQVCKTIIIQEQNDSDKYRRKNGRHFSANVNYLGVSDQNASYISYMTPDRIERLREDMGCNIARLSPSVLNLAESQFEGRVWEAGRRYHGRAGKVIRKLFTEKGLKQFSDKDIEHFSNLFKAHCDAISDGYKFVEVKGSDIKKYYYEGNYSTEHGRNGPLWSSCMKYEECKGFFKIFTENPDQVGMLVLLDKDEKALGRALIWRDATINDKSEVFMDRIYYAKDSHKETFKSYAEERGWFYKSSQSHSSAQYFDHGSKVEKIYKATVELPNNDFEQFPYMDTFYYMGKGKLFNYDSDNALYKLNNTGGERRQLRVWDGYNERVIQTGSARWCEHDQAYCHYDDARGLDYTSGYAFPTSVVIESSRSGCILTEDAVYIDGRTYYKAHIRTLANGDKVHKDRTRKCKLNGKYYLKSDCAYSNYHNDYIPKELSVKLENNEWVIAIMEEMAKEAYGIGTVEVAPETDSAPDTVVSSDVDPDSVDISTMTVEIDSGSAIAERMRDYVAGADAVSPPMPYIPYPTTFGNESLVQASRSMPISSGGILESIREQRAQGDRRRRSSGASSPGDAYQSPINTVSVDQAIESIDRAYSDDNNALDDLRASITRSPSDAYQAALDNLSRTIDAAADSISDDATAPSDEPDLPVGPDTPSRYESEDHENTPF